MIEFDRLYDTYRDTCLGTMGNKEIDTVSYKNMYTGVLKLKDNLVLRYPVRGQVIMMTLP